LYSIKDVLVHIWKELVNGFKNHLFLAVFLFFIVITGTSGIWIIPVFIKDSNVIDSFDRVGILTYCAPLISMTIFDASLRAIVNLSSKKDSVKYELYAWVLFFTIFVVFIIIILISSAPDNRFSYWSFGAFLISILYWFVVNSSNESYRSDSLNKRSSSIKVDSSDELMDGGN